MFSVPLRATAVWEEWRVWGHRRVFRGNMQASFSRTPPVHGAQVGVNTNSYITSQATGSERGDWQPSYTKYHNNEQTPQFVRTYASQHSSSGKGITRRNKTARQTTCDI